MAGYTTLSRGNGYTAENKKLQQALTDAGYGSYLGKAGVDGIYGAGTDAAVRAYQKDNGLKVDGIACNETLGHLYGSGTQKTPAKTKTTPAATEPAKSYRYNPDDDPLYQAAVKKQQEVEAKAPVYAGTFDQQVNNIFDAIMNQKDFSYDLNGDALWKQYKDQHTTQGRMAMMDTMGQTAALTGGFGSSYSQNAGQQAYQGYLQQLNDRIPELHQLALDKYNSERALLNDKFGVASQMKADEYGRYQDDVAQHNLDVDRAREDADTAYNRGSEGWYTEYQLREQDDDKKYNRQQDSYNKLANMISTSGYTPSQAELDAAGMSRTQAAAYAKAYEDEQAAARAKVTTKIVNEGDGGDTLYIDYKGIGVDNSNALGEQLEKIAEGGNAQLQAQLDAWYEDGLISEEAAINLFKRHKNETGNYTPILTPSKNLRPRIDVESNF